MKGKYFISILSLLIFEFAGCTYPVATALSPTDEETAKEPIADSVLSVEVAPSPSPLPTITATPQPLGPLTFPENVNPLNGLPVKNAENLKNPPLLVSISNFPVSARPQAGLSYCPIVFELWIGEGMTRFLCVFYGDFPQEVAQAYPEDKTTTSIKEPTIGPIRSGRITYEYIRELYNGYLVMASAAKYVSEQLKNYTNFFGSDLSNPNSAMMKVSQLEALSQSSQKELGEAALSGMYFDTAVPEGGRTAQSLWLFYSYLNQIFWRYDEESGTYRRWQDKADGATFVQSTERITGEPLSASNVVVLFADHNAGNSTNVDISLLYIKRGKALLFRDGQKYDLYWTTASEEYEKTTGKLRPIRFIDAKGNPFPLKPGQTWIEIVPSFTPYWETVDSEVFNRLTNGDQPGSGYWAVRVHTPK